MGPTPKAVMNLERKYKPPFGLLLFFAVLSVNAALIYSEIRRLSTSRAHTQRSAEILTRNLAQAMDSSISHRFQRIDQALLTIVGELERSLARGPLDRARMEQVVDAQEKLLPEVANIRVTDAEGIIIIHNPVPDSPTSLQDRPYWAPLREDPQAQLFITKPLRGVFTKDWVITSARRYRLPDGRFGGVVAAPVPIDHLQKALDGFEIGSGGILTLRDGTGGFVARHPTAVKGRILNIGDRRVSPELERLLDSGVQQQTYFAASVFDGTKRTLTFRRIQNIPYLVVASLAEDDYLAPWRADRNKALGVLGTGLICSWILAWGLWRLWRGREGSTRELAKREAQFRSLAETSTDYIMRYDAQGRHTYMNPAALAASGVAAADMIGKTHRECGFPEELCELWETHIQGVFRTGRPDQLEFEWTGAEGPVTLDMRLTPEFDAEGRVASVLGVSRDITERKRAEALLTKITALVPGVVYTYRLYPDKSSCFPYASAGMSEIYEVTPEEVRTDATPVFGRLHPEDLEATAEAIFESARTLALFHWEFRVILPRQGLRWRMCDARPERMPDGSTLWYGIITDITERRKLEEDRRRLEAQMQHIQKMESLGSLAGGVAHDMNNVLGAILGLASANLDGQAPGGPAHRAFETIVKAAERGGKMVKGLLSFARQSPAEERELDLNAILREEIRLLERTTLARVKMELDLADELRTIRGDASALTHAFMNLCVNAVDAMPQNGTIRLRTRNVDNDWIEVTVEDTGTGMPKEVLDKAMDPFFTTKEVGKGTGLGLSMVYSTVKAHRGQMEIQSDVGQGTCVRMRFPACETIEPLPECADAAQTERTRVLTVLVVDDDELIQFSMQALLDVLGHRTLLAPNGEEALEQLEAGAEPDVVILDMNMPGLGGAGTLPRLRRMRPQLPVLLATGRADQSAFDLVERYPPAFLLSKPFNLKELEQQLEAVVRPGADPGSGA